MTRRSLTIGGRPNARLQKVKVRNRLFSPPIISGNDPVPNPLLALDVSVNLPSLFGYHKAAHMSEVIVGYGDFKDYQLQELPDSFLKELAARYPLSSAEHARSNRTELLITIAVHEELLRRTSGGKQLRRRPTKRELAQEIVTKGFHSLSKTHHPDRNGDNDTQRLLTSARDFLQKTCTEIEEHRDENAITIDGPAEAVITDEDIPF